MRILLDASVLLPFQVSRDQHARRLGQIVPGLVRQGCDFVTTNWTLYEALALANRYGHAHARSLFSRVAAFAVTHPVDSEAETEALRRFLTWSDKSASVVDHANLLVAVYSRCDAILSFDEDFAPLVRAAGLQLIR
jgi:predicted nucleic acid-binding protein